MSTSSTASATATVLAAPGATALEREDVPAPGPGQLLLRVEGCGVCGSDLPMWEGRPWFDYPRPAGAPGHEPWGTVEAVGDGVQIAPGTRVSGLAYRSYAEFDLMDADAAVPLPPELDGRDFPGEALGCAFNVFRRSGIERGQAVAVVGVGFLGAVLVQLAARAGARVIAVSRRPFARETAQRMGAEEALPLAGDEPVDRIAELTGGALCERVIECTGRQEALDLAGKLTAERGRLVIAGFHQDGPRQVDMQLWNWRGLDVVNAHERDPAVYVDGIRRAAEAVASGALDPEPLYTHRFPLARADEALETARRRPEGFLKALVTP